MKISEQDPLLNAILASEDLEHLRRSTLQQGLAAVRRRRQARKAALACASGFALMASLLLLLYDRPVSEIGLGNRPDRSVVQPTALPRERASFERIGDGELLALFPNESVALLGPPGKRHLLVFAASPPAPSAVWQRTPGSVPHRGMAN